MDGSLAIAKENVTYSVNGGTQTYGEGFTLPTPTITGGTPTGTPTVKVYDANNVDVTAQATAGTLIAGTYTVKTLLADTNYNLASTGNTNGTLIITALNSGDVVTTIVNGATVTPPAIQQPNIPNAPSQQTQRETAKLMNAIMPGKGYELVSSPSGLEPVKALGLDELQAAGLSNGMNEIRVPLGNNSSIELVNGGLNLPKNVSQEFYVVDNSSNSTNRSNSTSSDDETNKAKKN